jgi:hypothetical protein
MAGADFEVVRMPDEVSHVESGAQIAGDVRAKLECHGGVAGRQVALGGAQLLHENAQNPATPFGPELDIDELRAVHARKRFDDAQKRLAIDAVNGGGRR